MDSSVSRYFSAHSFTWFHRVVGHQDREAECSLMWLRDLMAAVQVSLIAYLSPALSWASRISTTSTTSC
jgi:hypothetical protein